MSQCKGKTALVSGGSRGIGRAAALALSKLGAQVLVHYGRGGAGPGCGRGNLRRRRSRRGSGRRSLNAHRPSGTGRQGSRRRRRSARHSGRQCRHLEAGYRRKTTIEHFDALFAVNVRAPYFLDQQLLPLLKEGSNIVITSSLAAHAAVGNLSAYAATQGSDRHPGKALRLHPRRQRRAGERRRSRRGGDGHVELRQASGRTRLHAEHAGAKARGAA